MVDQNLDAQNRPDNSASFNESLQNQVTAWIRPYRLPSCLSEYWTKTAKTDTTVDQNLGTQNQPNNSAPFNKSLQILVTALICLYRLPGCLSEFWTKKRCNWCQGGAGSRCLEPPRRFSPFQWITTNPGYCVNLSIPSAAAAAYQNFEHKKTKLTPWWTRI